MTPTAKKSAVGAAPQIPPKRTAVITQRQIYFANSDDLHFALMSSHSYHARWGLANCLFETEKQAEWYITTKMRHLNVDYKNTIRPALYWVDDYILKDLREALTLDKDRPDKVILNEYMQYLYSK